MTKIYTKNVLISNKRGVISYHYPQCIRASREQRLFQANQRLPARIGCKNL